ncbi:hypothetical protein QWY28_21930 [Nocardioides sp. SOB77]|uniref:Uncharacterized protein n=1 Tax=Nocardioides oceani TaxID=3058369 RepID=A0ABT8FML2_9ACTN|nr:hypothetical protein [Nocardioides oceani]MDN4175637.1 hypothetical protein [Nocardioides oceani]
MRRIRDKSRAQHAAIVSDDSWTVTEAGGVLEFNTTDMQMIMNPPLVVLTDVQVDDVPLQDAQDVSDLFLPPPPRLADPQ